MTANSIFLAILIGLFIGSLVLQVACVRWGLRWARVADVSYLKAFGLSLVFLIGAFLIAACTGIALFALSIEPSELVSNLFGFAFQFIATSLVIAFFYKVRILRGAQAAIPFSAAAIAMPLIVIFLFRPFTYEAFAISTNAMAPTLLGEHWEAPCPRCGEPAYGASLNPPRQIPEQGVLMICSAERRPVYVTDVPPTVYGSDCIVVSKLIEPRRWDLIVFRYPENPTIYYVMRLVGLPNENLSIRDGAVWIDGKKLDPPERLQGLRYSPTIEMDGHEYSGPGSIPVQLGPDEYFVLGDFTEQSSDSRFWETGAPGYPPYAVPESHIVGVAINTYWPPTRWISFR